MQGSSATYPCTWCIGIAPFDEEFYELRTFEQIEENYNGFEDLKAEKGEKQALLLAKDFYSVVRKSLIKGRGLILDKTPPGELHAFLGVGNKIFDSLFRAMFRDAIMNYKIHKASIQKTYVAINIKERSLSEFVSYFILSYGLACCLFSL